MEVIQKEQEKAILVVCKFMHTAGEWEIEESEKELKKLATSSGAEVLNIVYYKSDKPKPALLIGKGKAKEVARVALANDATMAIFDHDLSPAQQRNLEEIIKLKTIDRTQLILDIFAQHANSQQGKLQVELAQLNYLLPRLVGKGIQLSRLGGGIGTRGPGEKKLEVDRRRIRDRINRIKRELKKVGQRKSALIEKRKKSTMPVIGLIGYTNAGKTTLLNRLTEANKQVEDNLFCTLDTVSRKFELLNGQKVILFDTVGFIQKLPHHLVESFKATLEEVVQADILLHIIDMSNPVSEKQADAVYKVLKELKAEDKKIITVLNKVDLIQNKHIIKREKKKYSNSVVISSRKSIGLKNLHKKLISEVEKFFVDLEVKIPQSRMDLVNFLYNKGHVTDKKYANSRIHIKARVPKRTKGIIEDRLKKYYH